MADPNVNRPEWDVESSEPPFRRRAMRLGSRAGAAEIGVTLYEIDAGGAVSPYHAHHANEELLLVLDGQPQLRTPDGSRRLQPGDTVAFPRGPLGAHRISNPGGPPARVLVFSTMNLPEVAEYPDTGTLLTKTGWESCRPVVQSRPLRRGGGNSRRWWRWREGRAGVGSGGSVRHDVQAYARLYARERQDCEASLRRRERVVLGWGTAACVDLR